MGRANKKSNLLVSTTTLTIGHIFQLVNGSFLKGTTKSIPHYHINNNYVQIPMFSSVFQISSTNRVRTSGEASGSRFPQHRIMRRDCVLVADSKTKKVHINTTN